MITKEELHEMLHYVYDDPLGADLAWEVYNRLAYYIDDGDASTINYFLKIMIYDHKDLLKMRTRIAENGKELTPNELSQYIFILNVCMLEQINLRID